MATRDLSKLLREMRDDITSLRRAMTKTVGAVVQAFTVAGKLTVGGQLRLTSNSDESPTSTDHPLQIGSGPVLKIDNNQIDAYGSETGGEAGNLYIQNESRGDTTVGNTTAGTSVKLIGNGASVSVLDGTTSVVGGLKASGDITSSGKVVSSGQMKQNNGEKVLDYSQLARHLNENTSLNRAYFGTGDTAMGSGQGYLGLGSSTDSSNSNFAWLSYDGNSKLNLSKSGDLKVAGRVFPGNGGAAQEVLWSGASYMHASQTASLSEKISDQPNGIILVWSNYSGGQAQDNTWTFHFVPKWLVLSGAIGGSYGMQCVLAENDNTSPTVISKYVYISDSSIAGNDVNKDGLATSRVLRFVLGC